MSSSGRSFEFLLNSSTIRRRPVCHALPCNFTVTISVAIDYESVGRDLGNSYIIGSRFIRRRCLRTEIIYNRLRTAEQFTRMVRKMDGIRKGNGTLLDHCLFTLGSGLSSGKTHISTDLPSALSLRSFRTKTIWAKTLSQSTNWRPI